MVDECFADAFLRFLDLHEFRGYIWAMVIMGTLASLTPHVVVSSMSLS